MSQVKNMDMLSKGTLVNVLWQWYLPGGSLEKNPLLNEVYVNCMGGWEINKKRNLHVWQKGQDMCWYPLDKVVALTRSPAAIPGTKNYFMDIRQ